MKRIYPVLLIVLSLLTLLFEPILAEYKWGKISREILEMNSFSEDSSVDAIVLFDIGKMEVTNDFDLELERHVRIKIFTEKGREEADIKIPFYHKDKINDIKGHTILKNGKKIKLNKKNVYEEDINKYWKQKVFPIPGADVGSVIEYKYKLRSEYLTSLEPWTIQRDIYTKLNQLSVKLIPGLNYTAFYQNVYGEETEPFVEEYLIPGQRVRHGKIFTWKFEDIPGIKREPHMGLLSNYQMKLFFQLIEYKDPYVYYKFIKSWDDLNKKLYERYKDNMFDNWDVEKLLTSLELDSLSDLAKVKRIYDYVRSNVETEWIYTIYPAKKAKEVFEDRKGNPSEKNMFLINILNNSGIHAKPILISTKNHGRLVKGWPQLKQFNLLLCYVTIGDNSYVLDTSHKYCPFGLLPPNNMVGTGLLIKEEHGDFVKIPVEMKTDIVSIETFGDLSENGNMNCETICEYDYFQAMSMREKLSKEKVREYLEEWLKDHFAAASMDSFQIENSEEIYVPLKIVLYYQIPEFAQIIGENIYFSPPMLFKEDKNPFQKEKREYPVEFSYSYGTHENITLKFPKKFKVDEIPQPHSARTKGGIYLTSCQCEETKIIYNRKFEIDKQTYYPYEYNRLRNFFANVINYDQSQVVLKQHKDKIEENN